MRSFVDLDQQVIGEYLDNAVMHREALNDWGEGFWLGRALEHADQNAVEDEWMRAEMDERGLDLGILAEPKPDGRGQG